MASPDITRGSHQQRGIAEDIGASNSAGTVRTSQGVHGLRAAERHILSRLIHASRPMRPALWRLYTSVRNERVRAQRIGGGQ